MSFKLQRYSAASLASIGSFVPLSENIQSNEWPAMDPVNGAMSLLWTETQSPGQLFHTLIKEDGTFALSVGTVQSAIDLFLARAQRCQIVAAPSLDGDTQTQTGRVSALSRCFVTSDLIYAPKVIFERQRLLTAMSAFESAGTCRRTLVIFAVLATVRAAPGVVS